MIIKPIGNRILVRLIEEEEKSSKGILLANTAPKERSTTGVVIDIGLGSKTKVLSIGEIVVLQKHAGTEVRGDGARLLIVSVDDVLGVISPEVEK